MPKYKITDQNSGLTIQLTGDSPPSDEELEVIFNEIAQSQAKEPHEETSGKLAADGSVLTPFLLGGLIGAGAMLLVSTSRKTAGGRVKKLAAGARDQVAAAVEKGKAGYETGIKSLANALQKGKSKYKKQKEKIAGTERPMAAMMIRLAAGTALGAGLSRLLLSEKGKEAARTASEIAISTGKRISNLYAESKSKASDTIEAGKRKIQERRAA